MHFAPFRQEFLGTYNVVGVMEQGFSRVQEINYGEFEAPDRSSMRNPPVRPIGEIPMIPTAGCGTGCGTTRAYVRPRFFAGQLLTEEDLSVDGFSKYDAILIATDNSYPEHGAWGGPVAKALKQYVENGVKYSGGTK